MSLHTAPLFRKPTRWLVPALAVAAALPAWAAFSGSYAPSNWTAIPQSFGCGSGSVSTAGAPNSIVLQTITGCANISVEYVLTNNFPANGTLSFSWAYTSNAASGREASYVLNGVPTVLATGTGPQNGTVSVAVTSGQPFRFVLAGGTNATLTISNFSAPEPPVPVPTLDFWARVGLAGLLGLTALWALRRQRR